MDSRFRGNDSAAQELIPIGIKLDLIACMGGSLKCSLGMDSPALTIPIEDKLNRDEAATQRIAIGFTRKILKRQVCDFPGA